MLFAMILSAVHAGIILPGPPNYVVVPGTDNSKVRLRENSLYPCQHLWLPKVGRGWKLVKSLKSGTTSFHQTTKKLAGTDLYGAVALVEPFISMCTRTTILSVKGAGYSSAPATTKYSDSAIDFVCKDEKDQMLLREKNNSIDAIVAAVPWIVLIVGLFL